MIDIYADLAVVMAATSPNFVITTFFDGRSSISTKVDVEEMRELVGFINFTSCSVAEELPRTHFSGATSDGRIHSSESQENVKQHVINFRNELLSRCQQEFLRYAYVEVYD